MVELADAALAIGRLDGLLSGLCQALRTGISTRLALTEVEAMLWAAGQPIPQEVLIRDLAEAPASVDLEALALARWAVGRLQGRGRLDDLRDFLGLHRVGQGDGPAAGALLRPAPASATSRPEATKPKAPEYPRQPIPTSMT